MGRFSERESLKFIEIYSQHPCLWNPKCIDYLNRELKTSKLQIIVDEINIPGFNIEMCRTKIKSFRTTYNQELRKVLQAEKKGVTYKPKLRWFDTLDKKLRNIVTNGKVFKLKEESVKVDDYSDIVFKGLDETSNIDEDRTYTQTEGIKIQPPEDDPFAGVTVIHDFETNSFSHNNQTTNEFDLFAMHIGSQLKSMPLENALKIQIKIQELIAAERVKLHNGQKSKYLK